MLAANTSSVTSLRTWPFAAGLTAHMSRARPPAESEAPGPRGIPMPGLYRIPSVQPDARAAGRDPARSNPPPPDGVAALFSADPV
jgi:hypothetical protein